MSLLEFATELINEAKLSTEAEETIFKLEQLKEVVFHREKGLVGNVFQGVIELMTRPFAADALVIAPKIVPDFITLFAFLVDDTNESVKKASVVQLSRIYDKVAMDIVNLKDNNGASTWTALKTLVDKVEDLLPSNESISIECLRLIESAVCFGFPSMDTRSGSMKGSAQQEGLSSFTSGDIPIHHPFINRQNIEKDAEATFAKLLLWLTRGGVASTTGSIQPFSTAFLFVLASAIAKITINRPSSSRLLGASKSLTIYISGLNKLIGTSGEGSPDLVGRENISRSIKRILSISSELGLVGNEIDQNHYSKLRAAMEQFDAETESKRTVAVVSDPRKRGRAAAMAQKPVVQASSAVSNADTEDVEVSAQLRESAIEAVNLMEMKLKTKAALNSSHSATITTASKISASTVVSSGEQQECVEFGYDTVNLIHNTNSAINPQDLMLSKLLTVQGNTTQSDVLVKGSAAMINVLENQYQNIGAYNLENYVAQLANVKIGIKSKSSEDNELTEDEMKVIIDYFYFSL